MMPSESISIYHLNEVRIVTSIIDRGQQYVDYHKPFTFHTCDNSPSIQQLLGSETNKVAGETRRHDIQVVVVVDR